MSKMKLLSIAVVGLLLVNAATLAFLFLNKPAPRPAPPGGPGGAQIKNIIIERLNFDKEQTEKYEELIKDHRSKIRGLDEQIKEVKHNLYSTLSSESAMNKDSLEAKLGEAQKQIEDVHYNHFADIKKLCKPEQMDAFNSLTKDLAKYFAPGKKPSGPPRD